MSAQAFALDNAVYTIEELQERLMNPEEGETAKSSWDSMPIEELRDMHKKKKAEFNAHDTEFEKAKVIIVLSPCSPLTVLSLRTSWRA